MKYESARKYFSAFKSQLETAGIDLPFYKMPLLQATRKSWKRSEHPPAKKVPITEEDVNSLGPDQERKHPVFVAVTRFGFDTLARLSEIGDAKWTNVTERKEFVSIHLDRAKTDPFGRDHQSLTISTATWREVKRLIPAKNSGRIFGGFSLTAYRKWISALFSKGLTGHSLRRGGAQRMFDEGYSIEAIKLKGRWRSEAWLRYVDQSSRQIIL